MRRFTTWALFLSLFSLILFGNSIPYKSIAKAPATTPPEANNDGIYIARTPTGIGNMEVIVPPPGELGNDTWDTNEVLNFYHIAPSWQHASLFTPHPGGGFTYRSSGTYVGWDSSNYQLLYIPYNPAYTDTAQVFLLVLPGDGAEDAGEFCASVGQPVNVTNGNMWLRQHDYSLPGNGENIEVDRFYNSIIPASGLFGLGWSTQYDESIQSYSGDQMLRLNLPDGRAVYFGRESTSDPFKAALMGFYGQIVKNGDDTYTLTFKDGRIHHFSSTGKLLWQKDRNNNQTTLSYNGSGHLTGVTDPFGRSLTVTPNSNGTVSEISDTVDTIATYEYYSGTTKLKTVTYNDGSKYKFEYGTNNKLETVKDALDNVLETHQYDGGGRAITSEKDGGVEEYTFNYSHWGDTVPYTEVTDANNNVTKFYFDKSRGRNLVTKVNGVCACGSGTEETAYEYDMALNVTKKTVAQYQETLYTYDASGNRLSMTDVLGTETYTYNSLGEILTTTDRMGGVTTNTYDSNGNLLTVVDALDNTTTLTYTSIGQLETVEDARAKTTILTYDSQGRLTEVENANNNTATLEYDSRARITSLTNAMNQTTGFEYDLNNRLKKVIFPDENFITATYDLAGRRTATTDERDNTTTYGFDDAYRLTSVTDPLSHTKTYGYDLMSNLTSQTDAVGNTTNFEYDGFNRPTKAIYPPATANATRLEEQLSYDAIGNVTLRLDTANREFYFDYDAANRLTRTKDAEGQITEYEYNARSQMTKVKDALDQEYVFTYDALGQRLSQTRAGVAMSLEYDAVGNPTERTDYNGSVNTYTYDDLNNLTTVDNPNERQIVYEYDALSRLISATNENGTVSFTYDNRGRIDTETDIYGRSVAYNYDRAGNRTRMKFTGDTNITVNPTSQSFALTYDYDEANRLTEIAKSGAIFMFGYDAADRLTSKTLPNDVLSTYSYDGMSRLTRIKHEDAGNTVLFDNQYSYNTANQLSQIADPTDTSDYGYDSTNRLTSVLVNNTSAENYSYDGVGNRTSSHLSSAYSHDPFNRLKTTDTASFAYDDNGNMTEKTQSGDASYFTWDAENRLKEARVAGNVIQYKYDALGRRVERTNDGNSTQFSYDGLDVVLDKNQDESFVQYINGLETDDKLGARQDGQDSYYLADHLGSTRTVTDDSGGVTDKYSYDSFGNPTRSGSSTRFQYTGRENDELAGLYYYRARWYDANLGRFISEDPIGFGGGDVNLYGYVWNNPQQFTDPSGNFPYAYNWGNVRIPTGGEVADYLDESFDVAERFYGYDPPIAYTPGLGPTTAFGALRGLSDLLRVGRGLGYAMYCEDNNYGYAAAITKDIARGSGLFGLLGGVAAPRIPARSFNPFKGKNPQQIENMFLNRKNPFRPSGPDPISGNGGYVSPSGRSFHIDPTNYGRYREPPHVDANRLRNYKGPLKKRKFNY